MGLVEYAQNELARIEKDDDGIQAAMNRCVMDIVRIFADQGHSGFSAGYAISILERLLRFKPISPLTGEDDEWFDPRCMGDTRQNRRCSSVFKDADGSCYDIDSTYVSDNGGITWFYCSEFKSEISFPYLPPIRPEKIYIEYLDDGRYEVITDQPERIKTLHDRKRKELDGGL